MDVGIKQRRETNVWFNMALELLPFANRDDGCGMTRFFVFVLILVSLNPSRDAVFFGHLRMIVMINSR